MQRLPCYLSYKNTDKQYANTVRGLEIVFTGKPLDTVIVSNDANYALKRIREDFLWDSAVTLFLIGAHSAENTPGVNQIYIKQELRASLYQNGQFKRSGLLGIVLPEASKSIYAGTYTCSVCGKTHERVVLNDDTVIREFSTNYDMGLGTGGCPKTAKSYAVLVRWESFIKDPQIFIREAFNNSLLYPPGALPKGLP